VSALLKLFPSWAWLVLACAVLASVFAFGWRQGGAGPRLELANFKLAQAEQRVLADRAREHRNAARQAAVDKEAQDGQEHIASIERQLVAARADGDGLRADLKRAEQRARALARAAGTGPGQPDPDPIGVFAGLLERADRRAETVAGYADRLRAAGLVCERGWDKVAAPVGVSLFK